MCRAVYIGSEYLMRIFGICHPIATCDASSRSKLLDGNKKERRNHVPFYTTVALSILELKAARSILSSSPYDPFAQLVA
ncbi:hypothetical protein H5410_043651 [Solanum commersonii]|uniref:Uncharacterized protein n=1 Tax=Solanum commersonii TaxID=4109 RepID=A0A9J5XY59_SOLCO|nr:hypothetical protein H5410_043651 [Solanum commersonii]